MRKYYLYFVHLSFLFICQIGSAQTVSLVSFYPASAFVVNRLLPFTLSGQNDVFIKSVRLKSGDQCQAFVDPYYNRVFHIYCSKPSLVSADIILSDLSLNQTTLSMGYINIFNDSLPGSSFVPAFNKSVGEE